MSSTAVPFVSVVLPTFNRVSLLPRAIASVLDQSYDRLELIVCDDGSTDGTDYLVTSLSDPRVRYERLQRNRGQAAARNRGLDLARGELVAFQDSDDQWLPHKLECHVDALRHTADHAAVTYSDMIRVSRRGDETPYASPALVGDRLVNADIGFWQPYGVGIQSTVIRRECFDAGFRFDEGLGCLEDLDLFVRLGKRFRFLHIPHPLVRYFENDGVSANWRAQLHARQRMLRRHWWALVRQEPKFLLVEAWRIRVGWIRSRGLEF